MLRISIASLEAWVRGDRLHVVNDGGSNFTPQTPHARNRPG
jgi:hypothetical protein